MSKEKEIKNKPLINLDDLTPRESVSGGNKGKRVFGSFKDKKKDLPKDRF